MKPYGPEGTAHYGKTVTIQYDIAEGSTPTVLQALEYMFLQSTVENAVTICDYGTADGSVSMTLMAKIIDCLKKRFGEEQEVQIFYEDQPTNDYKSLFHILHESSNSYLKSRTGVFVSACSTEFYSRCFPKNTIHFGLCTTALHWLSYRPCGKRPWFCYMDPECSKADEQLFAAVAKDDYNRFLIHRSQELRKGGQLVISHCNFGHLTTTARTDRDIKWWQSTFPSQVNKCWKNLLHDAIITQEEFESAVMLVYCRSSEELSAPFHDETSEVYMAGLRLVSIETKFVPCSFQAKSANKDRREHAQKYVESLRASLNSTFLDALGKERSSSEKQNILDKLFLIYEDNVTKQPEDHALNVVVHYVHIRKEN